MSTRDIRRRKTYIWTRKNSTSVGAARLVALRVPFHSESKLMVAIPSGPLCLRPEDPPAVPIRPAPRGLLHERDGVAHQTRDQIILQKQQMYAHSHVGARIRVHTGSSISNNVYRRKMKRRTQLQLFHPGTLVKVQQSVSRRGVEKTGPSWSGESASRTHVGVKYGETELLLPDQCVVVDSSPGSSGGVPNKQTRVHAAVSLTWGEGRSKLELRDFNKSQPSPNTQTRTHTHARAHTHALPVCVGLALWAASSGKIQMFCLLFKILKFLNTRGYKKLINSTAQGVVRGKLKEE